MLAQMFNSHKGHYSVFSQVLVYFNSVLKSIWYTWLVSIWNVFYSKLLPVQSSNFVCLQSWQIRNDTLLTNILAIAVWFSVVVSEIIRYYFNGGKQGSFTSVFHIWMDFPTCVMLFFAKFCSMILSQPQTNQLQKIICRILFL